MIIGNFKISRWVLVPEMALCFVPMTMAWLDGLFGMPGIVRLNMDIIRQYFIGAPGGAPTLVRISHRPLERSSLVGHDRPHR